MKRILSLFLAWALILGAPLAYSPAALGQVAVDGTKTGTAGITSTTWANKAAASAVAAGTLIYVADVGEGGTHWVSNATRWNALSSVAPLKYLVTAVTGVANTETIVMQTLLPVNTWQVGDIVRIRLTLTKSGTTDNTSLTVRVGTAGTTGDTAITSLSNFTVQGATSLSGGYEYDIKLISATSAQKVGNPATGASSYWAGSTSAAAAATTITSAAANALYISVAIASSGATNTVSIPSGSIHYVTP